MGYDDILKQFESISSTSSETNYTRTCELLFELNIIPFITGLILEKGTPIYRNRINRSLDSEYNSFSDLSYNPNTSSIGFGRCNKENQSIFYAGTSRPTVALELLNSNPPTSRFLREEYLKMTISTWTCKNDIYGAFIPEPDQTKRKTNSEIKWGFIFDQAIAQCSQDDIYIIKSFYKFVSAEFYKNIINGVNYNITAALSNFLLFTPKGENLSKVSCVGYESTRFDRTNMSNYEGVGFNIALPPSLIDEGIITLETAYEFVFRKVGEKSFVQESSSEPYLVDYESRTIKYHI